MELKKELEKKVVLPYKKRKKIIDLKKLEKYKIKKTHLFLVLILSIVFLLTKRYFVFFALTFISSVFSYYHSLYNKTPMDFKFALFLGLYITRYYGIHMTLIFFILSDVIPALLGGEAIEASTFFFSGWYFIVNAIVYLFPNISLIYLGPVLVIVEAIGSAFINKMFGIPAFMSVLVSLLTILVRIIYFLTLGNLIEVLIK